MSLPSSVYSRKFVIQSIIRSSRSIFIRFLILYLYIFIFLLLRQPGSIALRYRSEADNLQPVELSPLGTQSMLNKHSQRRRVDDDIQMVPFASPFNTICSLKVTCGAHTRAFYKLMLIQGLFISSLSSYLAWTSLQGSFQTGTPYFLVSQVLLVSPHSLFKREDFSYWTYKK